ncbi:hypothetical protein M404DRAFT_1006438 [Pisolithus tinctorius Marx 270]|uniref:Uncharacterized protein n=1 Tax=Pisolithus tinctorius Marx 270 TaxID=870435 RepID=A0A0C3JH56_PISTI|nr:hypothetical protein M404DRAFT_1006438 [Pisolithus tinctorius Marx 270]
MQTRPTRKTPHVDGPRVIHAPLYVAGVLKPRDLLSLLKKGKLEQANTSAGGPTLHCDPPTA